MVVRIVTLTIDPLTLTPTMILMTKYLNLGGHEANVK